MLLSIDFLVCSVNKFNKLCWLFEKKACDQRAYKENHMQTEVKGQHGIQQLQRKKKKPWLVIYQKC
jgi:hypothetical protein